MFLNPCVAWSCFFLNFLILNVLQVHHKNPRNVPTLRFNLTMHGHAHCVQFVRQQNIPFILLGGGGYTLKNVAQTWTYETACALGIEESIDPNLPWNQYFDWIGPQYRLEVAENNMDDLNVKDGPLEKVR